MAATKIAFARLVFSSSIVVVVLTSVSLGQAPEESSVPSATDVPTRSASPVVPDNGSAAAETGQIKKHANDRQAEAATSPIRPKSSIPSTNAPKQDIGQTNAEKQNKVENSRALLAQQRLSALAARWQGVKEFHRENTLLAVVLDVILIFFGFIVLSLIISDGSRYAYYPLTLSIAFTWAWYSGATEYFWVFALGMATAFAEIIGKFRDEPLQSVKTGHAVAYHIFNGLVAVFALYLLEVFTEIGSTPADQLKKVLAAGLGSMLIMRSKLFNIKVAGEDVSFGPEQIVKIFLSFMEEAIDRIRAGKRIEFVKHKIENLNCERSREIGQYVIAMMCASQTRSMQQMGDFSEKLDNICGDKGPAASRDKCYVMLFEVLNAMGENFVETLLYNAPAELRAIAPPSPSRPNILQQIAAAAPFVNLPTQETQYYFAYGTDMSGACFRERLKWSEAQFKTIPPPKKAELQGYRIAFNNPDADGTGCANLMPDQAEKVEGALYLLTQDQMHFLDGQTTGYKRKTMRVSVDSKSVDAEVYFAPSRDGDPLKANQIVLAEIIKGAQEMKLSEEYVQRLASLHQ